MVSPVSQSGNGKAPLRLSSLAPAAAKKLPMLFEMLPNNIPWPVLPVGDHGHPLTEENTSLVLVPLGRAAEMTDFTHEQLRGLFLLIYGHLINVDAFEAIGGAE